jgi:hypothetical protein
MVLQKDIVIPAGTVFECCDGMTRRFVSDNYEAIVGLSKDSSGSLVYSIDPRDPGLVGLFKEQTP